MIALVTGASGFIGSHLVELLLKKNSQVRCLLRKTSSKKWLEDLPVEFVYGDLFTMDALRDAVSSVDYVYHSAGLTKARTREEYERGNTLGTRNLLDAVLDRNPNVKRFVQISSGAAAGPSPSKAPINEANAPHPITTYGRTKWEAELECLKEAARIPITIVRPPVVYGPRDKDVFEFFHTMSKGLQPMSGLHEKYVSIIHVTDLVRGFVMAAESEKAAGQTYFLTSTSVHGWREIGDLTKKALGRPAVRVKIPEFGIYTVAAFAELFARLSRKPALINFEKARDMVQDYWTSDPSKAKRDFGFEQQISLEDGIRDTIAWYKQEKWL